MTKRLLNGLALLVVLASLAACSKPQSAAGLKAPWADGERTSYVIQDRQGTQVGTADLQVAREGDAYVLKQVFTLPGVKDDITLRLRQDDLKPLGGHREITTSEGLTTIDTTYADGKLSIKARTPKGEDRTAEIDVPADAYDNDQALFLWRALPFAEGYQSSHTIVVAANALKPAVKVAVVGKEKVTTPAGEFEAWKLEMEAAQQKQYLWYAVAAPNYLLKYDNGATIFLLAEHS